MDVCPQCGEPPRTTCKCPLNDRVCPAGHHWHECPVHRKLVIGEADHVRLVTECRCQPDGRGAVYAVAPPAPRLAVYTNGNWQLVYVDGKIAHYGELMTDVDMLRLLGVTFRFMSFPAEMRAVMSREMAGNKVWTPPPTLVEFAAKLLAQQAADAAGKATAPERPAD